MQGLCRVPDINGRYGVPQLSPALDSATDLWLEELGAYGYTDDMCRTLRARAHSSQVDATFSLVGELIKNAPNVERLKHIYNTASTTGAAVAALWSELHHNAEQMYAHGPMRQLKGKARKKLRGYLRNKVLKVTDDDGMAIKVTQYESFMGTRISARDLVMSPTAARSKREQARKRR